MDFQIKKRIVSEETIWGNTVNKKFGIRKFGCSMSWTRYKMWNWNLNLKWSLTFGLPCVSCHVRRDQPFHARHVQVWAHAKCKKSWLDTNFGYSFTYSYFFITLWYFRYFSILEKVARTLEIPQTHREPEYKKIFILLPSWFKPEIF